MVALAFLGLGALQLVLSCALFALGVALLTTDGAAFRLWIREDGVAEWVTAMVLAWGALLAAAVALYARQRPRRRTWWVIAALMLFGALEEISWGQRIFGWESPAWFLQHNAQLETNVHNLRFHDVKLNRWVFGKGLAAVLLAYVGVLPWLYARRPRIRELADRLALPIARRSHILIWLIAIGAVRLMLRFDSKVGELGELIGASVFVLILTEPRNRLVIPLQTPAVRGAWGALAALARLVPSPIRAGIVLIAANWAVFLLLRLGFWLGFGATAESAPEDLLRAFWLGSRFDLRLAALIVLPLVALAGLRPLSPYRSGAAHRLWSVYFVVTAAVWTTIYAVDFGHYGWLDRRLEASALEHLLPLDTAARVVWESYPVVWIAGALGAFLLLYGRAASWVLRAASRIGARPPSRWSHAACSLAFIFGLALALLGSASRYPLRWSHAFFSPEPFTSALALNPVLYLADTWPYLAGRYRADPARMIAARPEVADYLGLAPEHSDKLERWVEPRSTLSSRPNVVVIILESFGANKTGLFGNPLGPTPNFDRIARRSLLFRSFFVASRGTARAIFSLLTGTPDVTRRASRNPMIVDQHLILGDFVDYRKLYFYTGDLAWGNLRGLLQNNVPGLRIFEEKDYHSPHNDGWGISDLHLFEEADRVFRATPEPFFAFIQTSGNHRPYTIPSDHRGFERIDRLETSTLLAAGIRSLEELNSLRFMDHALGQFFAMAQQGAYFDNTLFVMLGDHGSLGSGSTPWQKIGLTALHVPLVIFAPARLEPREIDRVVSSLDLMPTLAGLAGAGYVNSTLGRDALDPEPRSASAFAASGLVEPEFFYTGGRIYRYRSESPAEDVAASFPDRLQRMERRWDALEQTALFLMHNNRKERAERVRRPSHPRAASR